MILTFLKKLGWYYSSFFFLCLFTPVMAYALLSKPQTQPSYKPKKNLSKKISSDDNQKSKSPHSKLNRILRRNKIRNKFSQSKLIQIGKDLEGHLLHIMFGLVEAHKNLKEKNQKKFIVQVKNIINGIEKIDLSKEFILTYHQRLYLYRQLQDIKENMKFIVLRGVSQRRKMRNLKKAYKELIQISQTYALNQNSKQYGVYFCAKNSSIWVQNSKLKVYNPFDRTYRNCGQKIR